MVDGNLATGFGGWGWAGSWESAAAESKPLRGHFQSECQSCHLLLPPPRRLRTAPVLPADPRRERLSLPGFPKRGGRTANFTPACQASSQDTSTASCSFIPVPSHPPPAPPTDVTIKTSVAVKRLMRVGGGGGGEGSGSHEPGPRLIQPLSKAEHLALGFICPGADGPVLHPCGQAGGRWALADAEPQGAFCHLDISQEMRLS